MYGLRVNPRLRLNLPNPNPAGGFGVGNGVVHVRGVKRRVNPLTRASGDLYKGWSAAVCCV